MSKRCTIQLTEAYGFRLLHPLSPRGKLVHWGLEGLNETNKLVQAACKYANHVVLRDEIYRLALDENHAAQLQQSAKDLPSIAEWLSADELKARMSLSRTSAIGALRLHNTCQVIHLPSYLEGLWTACVNRSSTRDSKVRWSIEDITSNVVEAGRLKPFDCVVLTAGSGMFGSNSLVDQKTLPVQLVRGQSVELEFSGHSREWSQTLLCGKYISPLPQHGRVLVGATHEYKSVPLSTDAVVAELRDRSYAMAPEIWDHSVPSKLTGGVRVQSERGKYGRRPMMGRLHDSPIHPNTWLFTGLSSRGLLYHGLYGNILVESILSDHEEAILAKDPGLLWWK